MSEPGCTATDAQTYLHTQNGKSAPGGAGVDEERAEGSPASSTTITTTSTTTTPPGAAATAGTAAATPACQIVLSASEQQALTATEWCHKWQQQGAYIATIEQRVTQQEGELSELRATYERTKCQLGESQQREKQLVRRLAAKEQEMQDYVCQVTELKTSQAPTTASLRSTLLDPAVNSLLQLLRAELQNTKAKLEETQNDLSAWKFTPDSNTGKRLMAKCRLLYQENEELGKMTSCGRIAILEGDLALQKKFSEEVRQSQLELDSFLADLDEDVDGMQSTIMFLQQELRRSKEALAALQKENGALRQLANGNNNEATPLDAPHTPTPPAATATPMDTSTSESVPGSPPPPVLLPATTTTAAPVTPASNNGVCASNGSGASPTTSASGHLGTGAPTTSSPTASTNSTRANGDSSGVCDEHDDADERTTRVKRVRRSSVLSIDYNDEDMCNTNGDNTMISDAE